MGGFIVTRTGRVLLPSILLPAILLVGLVARAQDSATATVRGSVADASGARIAAATLELADMRSGVVRTTATDSEGLFWFQLLPPGEYSLKVRAAGMSPQVRSGIRLEVGGAVELEFALLVAGAQETVSVEASPQEVETQPAGVSHVVDERAISQLPLNGRRFSDLALLTPGVTQDPRGLTSATTGDLAFGGVRGVHSTFLVDGADNNNSFFAQARGRYRAPYQFSNEVVQEFRVSSNTYGAEQGRAAGAVINVVTKSGGNYLHGTAFYYLRDGRVSARHRFLDSKPADRQHQFGFTLGGPIKRSRVFFYAGYDQHIFRLPAVVRFADGSAVLVPQPNDYESTDRELVFAAAEELSGLAGQFGAELKGNAGFFKLDFALNARHFLSARLSTSRYSGENNVFIDPASPVTHYGISGNGREQVSTESVLLSLTSSLSFRATSHLRVQFSRDLQESQANSEEVRTKIDDILEGFGRSSILPRQTHERRLHIAETVGIEGGRHSWKLGGDLNLTWVYNFFPSLSGGEYIFDRVRVHPLSWEPWIYGLRISPLRAYAHGVPRYYIQNFGDADSHPSAREYALFVQDTIKLRSNFAVSLGLRYDRQVFASRGLVSHPLWPDSGKLPVDSNNLAPRLGFAWSIGDQQPVVVRGGFGMFYTRLAAMYASAVETDNGTSSQHLFLDHANQYHRAVFPTYPQPAVFCAATAATCSPPADLEGFVTRDISSFAANFQTPYVTQASLSVERQVARRFAVGASYLYVHGQHLIRVRDANLPPSQVVSYPLFDGDNNEAEFLGEYYDVHSFSNWEFRETVTCPFPPCLAPLERPLRGIGAINVFENAASSVYHGFTLSARRRMTSGLYFRLAYTWAKAIDNGPDGLVVGRPALVENSHAPQERGRSVTDQRHRLVVSWIYEPQPFTRGQELLARLFNDWRIAGVVTAGSGRPVNARVTGDANRDDNSYNDRLPGASRNSFNGPDYATSDLRLSRRFYLSPRVKLEAMAEVFNVFNRTNYRVTISDDGFLNTAAKFVPLPKQVGVEPYPGYFVKSSTFLTPTDAYAPRQVQFALRLRF